MSNKDTMDARLAYCKQAEQALEMLRDNIFAHTAEVGNYPLWEEAGEVLNAIRLLAQNVWLYHEGGTEEIPWQAQ